MPNRDQIDGDVLITGKLTVLDGINDTDISEVQAAAQSTASTVIPVIGNVTDLLTAISNLESDGQLTPVEKLTIEREWGNIEAEYPKVKLRAEEAGIISGATDYDNYVTAYEALDAYLNTDDTGVIFDLTTTEAITGSTLRTNFANYFTDREDLLLAIAGQTLTLTDEDLIAYWPLSDAGADTDTYEHYDVSGNGHDLVAPTGLTTAIAGRSGGQALSCGAVRLYRGWHADFSFTGDYSIVAWVYFDSTTPPMSGRLYAQHNNSSNGVLVFQQTDGYLRFSPQWGVDIQSDAVVTAGEWHHVVCVRKSDVGYMYIDTTQQAETLASTQVSPGGGLAIYLAGDGYSPYSYLDGRLQHVMVFGRALTIPEIHYLYANPSGVVGPITTEQALMTGAVGERHVQVAAITAGKIAAGAVTADKIGSRAVETGKIAIGGVTATELGAAAVETAKLDDGAVTSSKTGVGAVSNIYENGDEIGSNDILLPGDFSCLWSDGRSPKEKRVAYVPVSKYDSLNVEYTNPEAIMWDDITGDPRGPAISLWNEGENVLADNDDYATAFEEGANHETITESSWQFDGHKMWRFECSNTNLALASQYINFDNATVCVRFICRRGADHSNSGDTRVILYEDTAANQAGANIDWATDTVSLVSPTTFVCEIIDEIWYSNATEGIVEVSLKFTSITTSSANTRLIVYPDLAEATGYYVELGAIQVEDGALHPTPYMQDTREISQLDFDYEWSQTGSIELWVRMRCNWNGVGNQYIITDYDSVDNHSGQTYALILRYSGSARRFEFLMNGSGTDVLLTAGREDAGSWDVADAFESNTWLHDWIHVKISWDIGNDNYYLDINGTNIDSETATDVGTVVFNPSLSIGSIPRHTAPATYAMDGDFCDLLIHDTADRTLTHGAASLPWADPYTLANSSNGVVIDKTAIKLLRAEIAMLDKYARQLDIGTQGLQARDRYGKMIHDIPNGPLPANNTYGGHIIWFSDETALDLLSTSSPTQGSWTDIQCVDNGIENATGAVIVYDAGSSNGATNLSSLAVGVYWRPKDAGWGSDWLGQRVYVAGLSTFIHTLYYGMMVFLPWGTDQKISYYMSGSGSAEELNVIQVGVLV